jgi:protein CSF1
LIQQANCPSDSIGDQLPFPSFSRLWNDQKREETRNEADDMHTRMGAELEQELNDYAIVETILETPQLELSYYWDEPGTCFKRSFFGINISSSIVGRE